MKYTLSGVKRKSIASLGGKNVIDCTATAETGEVVEGSIWELQKDGSKFPGFDALKDGSVIEAKAWTSSNGKTSFFPPKPEGAPAPKRSPAAITKAMETKAQNIASAQDNKERAVRTASTMSGAVQIVCAFYKDDKLTETGIQSVLTTWRKRLWDMWDDPERYAPF